MTMLGKLRCAMGTVRAAIKMSIWIAAWGTVMYYAATTAGQLELRESVCFVIFGILSVVTSFGALWLFWVELAPEMDFWIRSYTIRYVKPESGPPGPSEPRTYAYEERDAEGRIRSVPFVRLFLDSNHPDASELHFPEADAWNSEQPEWARGRRDEIMQRAKDLCGPATRLAENSLMQA